VFQSTDFPAFAWIFRDPYQRHRRVRPTPVQLEDHLSSRVNAYNQYIPRQRQRDLPPVDGVPSDVREQLGLESAHARVRAEQGERAQWRPLQVRLDIAGYASYNGGAICNYQPGCKYPLLEKGKGPAPNTCAPFGASPRISLSGYTIALRAIRRRRSAQRTYQFRDNFTMGFDCERDATT